MSDEIRARMLLVIESLSQAEPNKYVSDASISEALGGLDVETVKRHMDILDAGGLILSANSMDGHAALLLPHGHLALEKLRGDTPPPTVGF